MIEIESFCSKSILPCYLLLFCYCIITRVSTTMLSNFYADLNAEEGAKSLMAMWLLILILLFFCFVMWSSDLKKKQDNFWRPGDGEGTSKQSSSSTNKVISFFLLIALWIVSRRNRIRVLCMTSRYHHGDSLRDVINWIGMNNWWVPWNNALFLIGGWIWCVLTWSKIFYVERPSPPSLRTAKI